jgi:hypothetical protein
MSIKESDTRERFDIYYQNVRGFEAHLHEIKEFLEAKKPSIYSITESFLYKNTKLEKHMKSMGYTSETVDAQVTSKNGHPRGGIAVLIRNDIAKHINIVYSNQRILCIQISGIYPLPLFLFTVYFPEKNEVDERKRIYDDLRAQIKQLRECGYIMICGDFNAKCKANGDKYMDDAGRRLLEFCQQVELIMVNTCSCAQGKFTRQEGNTTPSTLDYCLVDKYFLDHILSMKIIPQNTSWTIQGSDHSMLILETYQKLHIHNHHTFHEGNTIPTNHTNKSRTHPKYNKHMIHDVRIDKEERTRIDWNNVDTSKVIEALNSQLREFTQTSSSMVMQTTDSPRITHQAKALAESFIDLITDTIRSAAPRRKINTQRKALGKISLLRDHKYRKLYRERKRLLANTRRSQGEEKKLRAINKKTNKIARKIIKRMQRKDWRAIEHTYYKHKTSKIFWSKLHRLRDGNNYSDMKPPARTITRDDGQLVNTTEEVVEVWKQYYQRIYNIDQDESSQDRLRRQVESRGNSFLLE